jgi:hypothetical protein
MLRTNLDLPEKLPMTSRQNQPRMAAIFAPGGLPGISRSDHREDHP